MLFLLLTVAAARVVVTSGVDGDFARPLCLEGKLQGSHFGDAVAKAVQRSAQDGALVLDTGGLLAFSGVARFAAQSQPRELAELAAHLGYRALFLGLADLSMPRAGLLEVVRELRGLGVPVVATNLRCDGERKDLCSALATLEPLVLGDVALIGVLPQDALSRVGLEEGRGLSIEDPALAIARATRAARAKGATFVIASVDDRPASAAAAKALDLAARLPLDGRPDLLLPARAGAHLLFARPPAVRPALAAAPPAGAADIRIQPLPTGDADFLVRPLPEATAPADAISTFVGAVGPKFCATWGRTLRGGHLQKPLDADGLLDLAARAARAAAHAEVVIVNRAAVDSGFRPAVPGQLAASDVFAGLPYDEPIDVAEVSGEWLAARAKAAGDAGVVVVGVDSDGKNVNGRPLEPSATYRVATLRFLAQGGDAALPKGPRWDEVPRASLRASLIDSLDEPEQRDPREALPDPAHAVEWTLRPDLDARFSSTSIANPGGYTSAPFQRSNVLTGGFEANGRLNADSPAWLWENAALWRYTTTKTSSPESITHDDLESFRTTLTERTLFAPKLPQPYVEGYAETEAASTDGAGSRRWLGRGSVGLRETPHPKLVLKLAAAVERQVGDSGPRTLVGANAQIALAPWELFRAGSRRVQVDALVDAFLGGDTELTTVRAHAGLTLELIGPVSLTLSADLYAERDGRGPFGTAVDTSAGLKVRSVERTSSF
jgi:hypothetical protein